MKFQKFVKSLGSDGVIYVRKNEERWLGFENVFMKIPDNIRSITASDILPMPESVEKVITMIVLQTLANCTKQSCLMPTVLSKIVSESMLPKIV